MIQGRGAAGRRAPCFADVCLRTFPSPRISPDCRPRPGTLEMIIICNKDRPRRICCRRSLSRWCLSSPGFARLFKGGRSLVARRPSSSSPWVQSLPPATVVLRRFSATTAVSRVVRAGGRRLHGRMPRSVRPAVLYLPLILTKCALESNTDVLNRTAVCERPGRLR